MNSKRHIGVLIFVGTILGVMTGLVIYSPTLYQMFCSLTGYNGTVQRAVAKTPAPAATSDVTIRVLFDANVAPGLNWEFRPEQRSATVKVGEPLKIYYYAKNNSKHTVVARASYNVTPYAVAPYFFKIQCFCFTNERLAPGESARMPVVLYLDQQMLKDTDTRLTREVTLSYTFYPQDVSGDRVAAARDLKAGSAKTEASLKTATTAGFDNDAPRD